MRKMWMNLKLALNRCVRGLFTLSVSPSLWKYIIFFLLSATGVGLLILWRPDFTWDIIKTAFGFFLGSISIYFWHFIRRMTEDYNKVTADFKFLEKKKYDPKYVLNFSFNGVPIRDYYDISLLNQGYSFTMDDHPEVDFEPDGLIVNNFFDLMKSHGGSIKKNKPTVRLFDISPNGKGYTIQTTRSTYFNHLTTNRAIDTFFNGKTTLRDIFEPGPSLKPLSESKMSNHIGLLCFVFLKINGKEYVILPERGKTSTISKGRATSSVAAPFTLDPKTKDLSEKTLVPFSAIIHQLACERLLFDKPCPEYHLSFLGIGRDVYEGGKPQFFYRLDLPAGFDVRGYLQKIGKFHEKKNTIDADKRLMVIRLDSLKYAQNDCFYAECITCKKTKRVFFSVEKSFFAHLYLLQKAPPLG